MVEAHAHFGESRGELSPRHYAHFVCYVRVTFLMVGDWLDVDINNSKPRLRVATFSFCDVAHLSVVFTTALSGDGHFLVTL